MLNQVKILEYKFFVMPKKAEKKETTENITEET